MLSVAAVLETGRLIFPCSQAPPSERRAGGEPIMFPLRDSARTRGVPYVNLALIVANVLVMVWEASLSPQAQQTLIYTYGFVPEAFFRSPLSGKALTIFTSMFLHGGWYHVISNMWALYIFGDNIESTFGHGRYLVFYLFAGVVAALAHAALASSSTIPTVGASGAIAGVMGAYLLLFPRSRIVTLVPLFFLPWFVEVPAVIFVGVWFLSQLFNGLFSLLPEAEAAAGVAWWAHVGGFAAGLALAAVYLMGGSRRRDY